MVVTRMLQSSAHGTTLSPPASLGSLTGQPKGRLNVGLVLSQQSQFIKGEVQV